jgi:hypothetical protein
MVSAAQGRCIAARLRGMANGTRCALLKSRQIRAPASCVDISIAAADFFAQTDLTGRMTPRGSVTGSIEQKQ